MKTKTPKQKLGQRLSYNKMRYRNIKGSLWINKDVILNQIAIMEFLLSQNK